MDAIVAKIHRFQGDSLTKKWANVLFYIAVIIEVLVVLVDKSSLINPFEGRLFQITFFLFLLKIVLTGYKLREYAVLFIFLAFGMLVDFCGERNEILRFAVFVFACKDIDMTKCMKCVLWIQTLGILVISILSCFGFGALTVEKEYQGMGFVDRFCFGMGNANSFHTMLFVTALLLLYLYHDRISWIGYTVLFFGNILFFIFTDSRTSMIMVMATILSFWIAKALFHGEYNRMLNWLANIGIVVYATLIAVSVWFAAGAKNYCSYYWAPEWERPSVAPKAFIILDKLLTGRILSLTEHNFEGTIESWNWFTTKDHTVYFDLGYVRVFYWYGIIPATIILLFGMFVLIICRKKMLYKEITVLVLIAIFTLPEAHFVSVYIGRSIPLFIAGKILWNNTQ